MHTIKSHGLAALPPGRIVPGEETYEMTLRLRDRPEIVSFSAGDGDLHVRVRRRITRTQEEALRRVARRMFRLDDDLSPFYAAIESDEELAWARCGAGRLLASPTVFEDVIRTICTTNCTWAATERMVGALAALGDGAFPAAARLAATPEAWFTTTARMGYRGAYVADIARRVASGELNLESLLPGRGLPDETVEARLLGLPGVGPYAAAHIMQLLGYHERLILDSWTRPTFAKRTGKRRTSDAAIRRRFRRYGRYAGLAFWLFLTRGWHDERPTAQNSRPE